MYILIGAHKRNSVVKFNLSIFGVEINKKKCAMLFHISEQNQSLP